MNFWLWKCLLAIIYWLSKIYWPWICINGPLLSQNFYNSFYTLWLYPKNFLVNIILKIFKVFTAHNKLWQLVALQAFNPSSRNHSLQRGYPSSQKPFPTERIPFKSETIPYREEHPSSRNHSLQRGYPSSRNHSLQRGYSSNQKPVPTERKCPSKQKPSL